MQVIGHPSPSFHFPLNSLQAKIKPTIGFESNLKSPYFPQNTHFRTKCRSHLKIHRYPSNSSNFLTQNFWFSTLMNSKSILNVEFPGYIRNLGAVPRIDFLLRRFELIRTLRFTLLHPKPEELERTLQILSHSFVKIHYLTSFSFELMSDSMPSLKSLRKLGSILQTMKSLTYLRISHFSEKYASENIISSMLKDRLGKLRSLSTFSLKLVKALMGDQEMKFLCSSLVYCKSLVQMEIELSDCPNLTNEGIKGLFGLWRDLKLTSLKLKLKVLKDVNEAVLYKDFDSLMEGEERSSSNFSVRSRYDRRGQKTTLRLTLEHPGTREPRVFELLIFQRKREVLLDFPRSKEIKALSLKICDNDADDDLSLKLTKSFNRMESLENLTFEIGISQKLNDFDSITQPVKNLESLKVLELKFKGFQLTDQQVFNIFLRLFQMDFLVILSLDLGECQVSQTVFETFRKLNSKCKNSSLTKLKVALAEGPPEKKKVSGFLVSLKRIFQQEGGENKRAIEEFWTFLRGLKELKSLDLKFNNMNFSKKEQREFANGLWISDNLTDSQVQFEYDYREEEEELKIFENLIVKSGGLSYLRTLKLQFKERDSIGEKYLRVFDFKVPGLEFSFQLKLGFRICYNEARKEIALLRNLADFVKKMGLTLVRQQSMKALLSICVDEKELEFIEVVTPADQRSEILKKFAKIVLLEEPRLKRYSLKIHSKNTVI